ncbi:MAG: septum formation inhibitor Maf [Oscillospiraceae bacterium]|nr:septum formation inhibitor Maf [Oscillospiraceae bacterium]
MHIVLASSSPRRKELMEMLEVPNLKILPAKGEEIPPEHASPGELVMALSRAKAREVAARCAAEDVIIGADTIVWVDGGAYGKPRDEEDAARMLRRLSGDSHEVYTGVTVIRGEQCLSQFERSLVRFRRLEEEEIRRYIATGEPMDKAGAYGAQGRGALFVEHIEGDFFNVMGLPLCRLGKMLKEQGVNIL